MSQIETHKHLGVQAVTLANIAQVLHVSTDDLLGLKAEKDGEKPAETAATQTVGACAARGNDRVTPRFSLRSNNGLWASRAASLHLEHTTHDDGSSVPTTASGHLHVELRQIKSADCLQLFSEDRIVEGCWQTLEPVVILLLQLLQGFDRFRPALGV
jgi:hypothetical protein